MRYNDMALYVIGPVTGRPYRNIEDFLTVRSALRAAGYMDVSIPHDYIPLDADWASAMRKSIATFCLKADGIVALDDFRASRGTMIERELAKNLGIPVKPVEWWIKHAEDGILTCMRSTAGAENGTQEDHQ